MLRPIGEIRTASYEAQLRLGYALLNAGALNEAEPYLQRAASAEGPSHWRTRGRARYDLALVAAKRGDKDKAYAELSKSIDEGYRPSKLDPLLTPIAQRDGDDMKRAQPQKKLDLSPKPSLIPDATPFYVHPSGELDANRAKSRPPEGFTTLHFGG